MAKVQIIPGNFSITDAGWPKVKILQTVTSDSFSQRAALIGSQTDCHLGGSPREWTGDADGVGIQDGALLTSQRSNAEKAKLEALPADIKIAFTVVSVDPTGGAVIISLRSSSDEQERVRLQIRQEGAIILEEHTGGSATNQLGPIKNAFSDGDRIELVAKGSQLTLIVNGTQIATHTVARVAGGDLTFSSYPVARIPLDDLVITEA